MNRNNYIQLLPLPMQSTFAMFSFADIRHELNNLYEVASTLYNIKNVRCNDISFKDGEWASFIYAMKLCFGSLPPETDTLKRALHGTEWHEGAALGLQTRKALKALIFAEENVEKQYGDQACLLLPVTYAQRFEMLIGEGRLPAASVTQFDVLKFDDS